MAKKKSLVTFDDFMENGKGHKPCVPPRFFRPWEPQPFRIIFFCFVWIHFPPSLDQSRPIVVQLFSLLKRHNWSTLSLLFSAADPISGLVCCAVLWARIFTSKRPWLTDLELFECGANNKKNPRSGRFYIKRKIKSHYNISVRWNGYVTCLCIMA